MLTERQSRILELVIRDHVETAVPVASEPIVRKYRLDVSSATIRNEMAELEEQGYLHQPHTSAGRVPTEKGYRFYVQRLMREEELPWQVQQTIRHQFHQLSRVYEDWVHLASSILARAVQNAAVVTTPRALACRIKHLQLVSLHDATALLVLVLDQGRLKQHVLALREPCTQDELSVMVGRLNRLFIGCSAEELALMQAELTQNEQQVMGAVEEIMRAVDEGGFDEAYLEGVRHMLGQPEFASSGRILALLELLDERSLTRTIPFRALAAQGITVIIGADNPRLAQASDAIRDCSVIVGAYGTPEGASGTLAVLGPMRMRYSHTVSTVRYLADVMSELLAQYS